MAYNRQTNKNSNHCKLVKHGLLGLAALATCAAGYIHFSTQATKTENARRQKLIEHYENQIEMIQLDIALAKNKLAFAETLIEKLDANRRIADLEREKRQYQTRIFEIKHERQ